MFVNVRDPRQHIVSLAHHFKDYRGNYKPASPAIPDEHEAAIFEDALQKSIDAKFELSLEWIEGWYRQRNNLPIIFSTYEDFVKDKRKHIDRLLDATGYPKENFDYEAVLNLDVNIDSHFRKGLKDEWKTVLSKKQIEFMNDRVPDEIMKFFGWER